MRTTFISILIGISLSTTLLPSSASAASVYCECIRYLREVQGVNIHGNANVQVANVEKRFVRVGDVILFDYGKVDHGAVVTAISEPMEGQIYATIKESNYHHCKPGTRIIPLTNPEIRGVYRPNLHLGLSTLSEEM